MLTYVDGRFVPDSEATISVRSRGLNYGLGCFAGVRGYLADDGQQVFVFRLDDHIRRLELSAKQLTAVVVPPGVAHGIYSWTDAVTLVGSTALYDPADDFEFHWADPALGIGWPAEPLYMSARDRGAQPLESLLDQIATSLDAANHTAAVQLANVPDEIRGYGHVKEKSIAAARELQEQRLRAFKNPLPGKVAA